MNSLIDKDDEFARGDRELTLSTGAILGIFLGLVLLCGLFFGFGYKMGSRRSAPSPDTEISTAPAPAAPSTDFNAFKPAAGSPEAGSSRTTVIVPGSPNRESRSTATTSAPGVTASHSASVPVPSAAFRSNSTTGAHPAPPSAASLAASLAAGPTPGGTGNFVVQVAAVSLQEDADLLAGALRSKGYTVTARAQPDKLIHIQVGPFASRKEADAMRQRLLADGYNALVK